MSSNPWSDNNFGIRFVLGCWGLHFQDWEAWPCQVPLCWHWHFHWKEAWGYCSFFSQLWCKLSVWLLALLVQLSGQNLVTFCLMPALYRFHMLIVLSISWLTFLKMDLCVCLFQPGLCLSIQLCLFGKYIPVCNIDDGILQVSLLTETGSTKDDTRLPTDEALQAQVS